MASCQLLTTRLGTSRLRHHIAVTTGCVGCGPPSLPQSKADPEPCWVSGWQPAAPRQGEAHSVGWAGRLDPEGPRVPGGETQRASGRRAHLVELLVKLAELGHLLHHLLPHEERRVDGSVALGTEALQGVLDQGLLQEHQGTLRDGGSHGWSHTPCCDVPTEHRAAGLSPSRSSPGSPRQRPPSLPRNHPPSPPGPRGNTSSCSCSPPRSAPPCCLHPVHRGRGERFTSPPRGRGDISAFPTGQFGNTTPGRLPLPPPQPHTGAPSRPRLCHPAATKQSLEPQC